MFTGSNDPYFTLTNSKLLKPAQNVMGIRYPHQYAGVVLWAVAPCSSACIYTGYLGLILAVTLKPTLM